MSERDPLQIIGQTIAEKYRIEKLVGEGGFAVVYRAIHTIWNKPVAIKFFNGLSNAPIDQRDQFKDAFIQEGALLTELSSQTASIVQARDVGTYTSPDGQWMPYMVLEWLEGLPLDELLDRERASGAPPWTLGQTLTLLGQAAGALDVAHGKGIAHRDIKPANLFVLGDGRAGTATVKVLDFGVAKMMSDNTQLKAALAKTGTNVTSFTPQYGAPEQFNRSYGATGPWTDVFALALVAVEMLSGKTALEGDDLIQLAVCSANPDRRPTPRLFSVPVPDAVEQVFQKALAIKPEDRYARAREFWMALETASGAPASAAWAQTGGASVRIAATELAPVGSIPGMTAPGGPSTTGTPSTITATGGSAASGSKTGVVLGGVIGVAALAAGAFFFLGKHDPNAGAAPPTSEPPAAVMSAPPPPASAAPAKTCPENMVQIPAGQYFMGSDAKDAAENEKPSHNVMLDSFCIDLYEVTAKDYKACSDAGKCRRAPTEVVWPKISDADRKAYSPLCTIADPNKQDHPINCVTWEMANTYCKAQDKQLPSEAQWEYATRGPDGRIYPWGDDAPTAAHLNACGKECLAWAKAQKVTHQFPGVLYEADDGYATTAPVGKFAAGRSRFGPYDVVGNVWEWVSDWEGKYSSQDQKNPTGPESGERKVIRGGAWNGSFPSWLHPSFRYAQDPKAQSHGIGFRCAKTFG